jgi:long-subunit fatty acid transport protein
MENSNLPPPDDTFDPQIPNANQHFFGIGGDRKRKKFTLERAYKFLQAENRSKNNAITLNGAHFPIPANGRYNTAAHLLGLSLVYQF